MIAKLNIKVMNKLGLDIIYHDKQEIEVETLKDLDIIKNGIKQDVAKLTKRKSHEVLIDTFIKN